MSNVSAEFSYRLGLLPNPALLSTLRAPYKVPNAFKENPTLQILLIGSFGDFQEDSEVE